MSEQDVVAELRRLAENDPHDMCNPDVLRAAADRIEALSMESRVKSEDVKAYLADKLAPVFARHALNEVLSGLSIQQAVEIERLRARVAELEGQRETQK